jgi:hypothetical protein
MLDPKGLIELKTKNMEIKGQNQVASYVARKANLKIKDLKNHLKKRIIDEIILVEKNQVNLNEENLEIQDHPKDEQTNIWDLKVCEDKSFYYVLL